MNDDTNPDYQVPAPRRSPGEPSAADLLGPRDTLAAQDQGYAAALAGEHVRVCPWTAGTTERERALLAMWIRGYAAGRTDLRRARTPGQ